MKKYHCFQTLQTSFSANSLLSRCSFSSWKNNGKRRIVATRHYAAKRQNTIFMSMYGITIISMLVNKAAKPQIKDDTLATLLFYFILFPISIAIRVPIKLQGPEINVPTNNIVRQQGQGYYQRASEIINITIELMSRDGLRNRALLLKWSARQPIPIPPTTAPISNIEQMYPFCYLITSLRSLRIVGSQKRSPQTHPLRHAQEMTQLGTRGRHMAEKIPYLNAFGYYFQGQFSPSLMFSALQTLFSVIEAVGDYSISDFYNSSSIFLFGVSFINKIINRATTKPSPPVSTQFHTKLTSLSERTLRRASAMIFPILLLSAQIPISNPFLFEANQLLKIPTRPGHPVAWKKPFMHIKIVITATLQNPVIEQITIHSIQETLEIIKPDITQNLRVNLCIKLPSTPIPMEQKARQRASTIPIYFLSIWNYFYVSSLEQDQPSRKAWRAAQPIKVRKKITIFSRGMFMDLLIQLSWLQLMSKKHGVGLQLAVLS